MGKKLIVVALAVISVALVLHNTKAGHETRDFFKSMFAGKKQVTEEKALLSELDDLTAQVQSLSKEEADLVHLIAEEDVAIRKLEPDLAKAEANSKRLDGEVRDRRDKLAKVSKGSASTKDLEALQSTLRSAESCDATVKSLTSLVDSRKERAQSLRQQREEIRLTQQELFNKLADLKARLVKLEVEQLKNPAKCDKGRVARLRESIDKIDTRIQVREQERKVYAETSVNQPVTTTEAKPDALQAADDYLNKKEGKAQK